MQLMKFILESGICGYLIVAVGVFGVAVIIERIKVLCFDFYLRSKEFIDPIQGLVLGDKIEQAITACSAYRKSPLVHVMKRILERANRDDEAISQGQEIAIAEVLPLLTKRLTYLAMFANVATLLGLLGTIQGLIMSFAAVSFADPSQKQAVLAQGISLAMNTTAMGLCVAIPLMMAYAFLNSRQNHLLEEVIEHSTKMVDLLSTRHYQPFSIDAAFPDHAKSENLNIVGAQLPPPPIRKSA